MTSPETVAVLGTGMMGAPMARNLLAAGFPVRVWNRTAEKAAPLGDAGAVVAGSPGEAADGASLLLTMLTDAEAVLDAARDALDGPDAWLQCSTVGLDGQSRIAALAAERRIPLIDAPVLGTRQPAEDGKLVVLAAGPASLHDRVAPVFDAVGSRTLWLGEAGEGQRLKLVANTWVMAVVEGLAETLRLAGDLGVPPERFLEAIAGGPLDAGYVQLKGKGMLAGDFEPSFLLRHAAKDLRLIEAATDLDLPLVAATAARFAQAVEAGRGDLDMSAVYVED